VTVQRERSGVGANLPERKDVSKSVRDGIHELR
jgi:hypothetical protein